MNEMICLWGKEYDVLDGEPLLWPALCYEIDVCVPRDSGSHNLFEQVVLRWIEISKRLSEDEIAEATCLPKDTVRFLVHSLQCKGDLDEKGQPTGKHALGQWATEHRVVYAFYDLITGTFLPELFPREKLTRYPMHGSGPVVSYTIGWEQGNAYSERACCLIPPAKARDRLLAPEEIQEMLRTYRRKWEPGGHYETAQRGDLVYLRTYLCRNLSSGNYLLKNPLGRGYAPHMYAGLLRMEQESPENWKRITMLREQLEGRTEVDAPEERAARKAQSVEGFGPELLRYPALAAKLRAIEDAERKLPLHAEDTSTHMAIQSSSATICKAVYDGLEETLHILGAQYELERWSKRLLAMSAQTRRKFLAEALRQLGLRIPQDGSGLRLLQCSKRSMEQLFENDVFSLPIVLVLNIAAAESEPMHPFWELRKLDRDALAHWDELKTQRDTVAHGGESTWPQDRLHRAAERFRLFVRMMLPTVRPKQSEDAHARVARDSAREQLLRADSKLRAHIGMTFFAQVGERRLERLRRIQCFLDDLREEEETFQDQALQAVTDCSGLLQQALEEAVAARPIAEEQKGSQIKAQAAELLSAVHAIEEGGKLPPALATVGDGFISHAQMGEGTTLGAVYLSWLGVGWPAVKTLHEQRPESCKALCNVICVLLEHRRHSNRVMQPVTRQELDDMWKSTLQGVLLLWENQFLR